MIKTWMNSTALVSACFTTALYAAPEPLNPFLEQSSITLTARNFYLDRNYQGQSSYPAAKDWSQGFILKAHSGYTQGLIGLGLDLYAAAGFKLAADAEHAGTGNLPRDQNNHPASQYGELAWTAKAKLSDTELRVGTLFPMNPVLVASPARLLPQSYRGISLDSTDLPGFDLHAAYIDQVNHRDSTNYENIRISSVNGRFVSAETDAVYFVGGDYQLRPELKLTAYYLNVNNLYQQQLYGIAHHYAISDQSSLKSNLRYYRTRDEGQAKAGNVENDLYQGQIEFKHQAHKLIFSTYQHHGSTAFPVLSGGEAGLLIDTWPSDFLNAKERVYSARYEYDFKKYLPGLNAMMRYTKGVNIDAPTLGGHHLKEDELDFELSYRIPSGWFKNLALRARYAIYDNNMLSTANIKPAHETRFNMDYTWTFK